MKRNFRTWAFAPAVLALGVWMTSCGEEPTALDQQQLSPLFDATDPANDIGACMGNDVLSYNALVPPKEKSSWSNTPEPNGNYCTAKDIYLATAVAYEWFDPSAGGGAGAFVPVEGDISCVEGETFTVKVAAQLGQQAASARTDIGVWIAQALNPATDPVPTQAVDGSCNHYNLVNNEDGVVNLDGDQCGDMNSAAGELTDLDLGELTLKCEPNENEKVEVPSCIGWTVPGGDRLCPFNGNAGINFRMGTVPVNTAKCNCEAFELNIVVLKSALLEVRKELDPTDDDGLFDLFIDEGETEEIVEEDASHGGTTGAQPVGAGTSQAPGATHTISEGAGTATDLSDYETTWECRYRGDTDPGTVDSGTGAGPHSIDVEPDDDIVCTFTNARKPEVRLKKVFVPSTDDGKVEFDIDGTTDDNTGAGYGHNGTTAWYQFDIGDDVDFSEAGFGSTDLDAYGSAWSCDNGESGSGLSGSTGELQAGDKVTCTFTNTRNPVVKVVKQFDPDDPGKVTFTIDGDLYNNGGAGFGDGEGTDFIEFEVDDDVAFSEAGLDINLANYTSSWSCDNGESGNGTSGSTGALAAGDVVTCTFTNAIIPVADTETAWAADGLACCTRLFNPSGGGSWATYVAYNGVLKIVTMFAGQTTEVGTVTFTPSGGQVLIEVELTGGWTFAAGSVLAVQGYAIAPSGNPSPGQFQYKVAPTTATTASVLVDAANFYAVHAVVE